MLEKLYSETNLLMQAFVFKPGLNIILGKYSGDKKQEGINGIGKSSLIRLINYALLSDSSEKIFLQDKYEFLRKENHNIVLEFKINDEIYCIKRYFIEKDKVYFGLSPNSLQEYKKTELKKILFNKFFPAEKEDVFLEGDKFGTIMKFFIKDDISNRSRLDPLKFLSYNANIREVAIYNFFLLNLPTKHLITYNDKISEYANYTKTIKKLQEKIKLDTGKTVEEFKTEKLNIENRISLLRNSLQEYKFLEKYKDIENQLIEITTKINQKLKLYYSLTNEHKKIKDSFRLPETIDTERIKRMYNEVLQTFGDLVTRTLEEILNFRREIIENRNKFLIERQNELEIAIKRVLNEISELENKRSELYKKLDEKEALDGIKNTYEQLIIEEGNLATNLATLNQIEYFQSELVELDIEISKLKKDIVEELKKYDNYINKLRELFRNILENAIFLEDDEKEGHFGIAIKDSKKRDELPFKIEVKVPKADALGQAVLRVIAYDLMVFLNNVINGRKFPDFLIHDGAYHGISINTKVRALNYIYHQHLANPHFQYIVTFNEDEIYIPETKQLLIGQFDFDIKEAIIAEFADTPEKMIFKRSF